MSRGLPFWASSDQSHAATVRKQEAALESRVLQLRDDIALYRQELVRLDDETRLLMAALSKLQPGFNSEVLAETLCALATPAIPITGCCVIRMDGAGVLRIVSQANPGAEGESLGLDSSVRMPTAFNRLLAGRVPVYWVDRAHAAEAGYSVTWLSKSAETCFLVPLGQDFLEHPFGLVAFLSSEQNAFTYAQRHILETMAKILARVMIANSAKRH